MAGSISSIPTAASGNRNGPEPTLGKGSLNARPPAAIHPAYATSSALQIAFAAQQIFEPLLRLLGSPFRLPLLQHYIHDHVADDAGAEHFEQIGFLRHIRPIDDEGGFALVLVEIAMLHLDPALPALDHFEVL